MAKPLILLVGSTTACPSTCPDCITATNSSSEISDYLLNQLYDFLESLGCQVDALTDTGGEPMTNPERVFEILDHTQRFPVKRWLNSNYLGDTEAEVENNIKELARHKLDGFRTSLDYFHQQGHPKSIKMDYIDYRMKIITELIKNNNMQHVSVQSVFDSKHAHKTEDLRQRIISVFESQWTFNKIGNLNGYWNYGHCIGSTELYFSAQYVISAGRAKKNNLQTPENIQDLQCPSAYQPYAELSLRPDGSIAPCPCAAYETDFGLGNANNRSLKKIANDVLKGSHFQGIDERLNKARGIINQEMPGHLAGNVGPCDVCNTIYHPDNVEIRKAVMN